MENDVIKKVQITVLNSEEKFKLGDKIHCQLVGNQDYIDSNIVLNFDNDEHKINLYFFKECKNIPEILI